MKTNTKIKSEEKTWEGAPAARTTLEQQLQRSVLACLLWENSFYESGESIAERIAALVPKVGSSYVANLAVEARTKYKLRHVPLLLVREMARHPNHKAFVAETLYQVIERADELAEFVALYWRDGRQPLSAQVKKGLARAFTKFNAYQLAKYDRDGAVKLRDVLFLCHAKPKDKQQGEVWAQLVAGTLPTPDTWEVSLSGGHDKKETWERLLAERKLGGLALLRNLRNMTEANVSEDLVFQALSGLNTEYILPFRFIAAAKHAPGSWDSAIEEAMLRALTGRPKLEGKTILLIDVSGSMNDKVSGKSDLTRREASYGLAILARELCERVKVYSFSNHLVEVPNRRGFALAEALDRSQPHLSTLLGEAVKQINMQDYDRLIVITDEQSNSKVPAPHGVGYVVNVAAYQNGVGYGAWRHIDGWSEAVFDYIQAIEDQAIED